jgi:metal-responsive CopG/Arc/MetJ family transcriptional regulator
MVGNKPGPAPTGQGTPILVRLHQDLMGPLDVWIANQPGKQLSRPEAIRTLLRSVLATE